MQPRTTSTTTPSSSCPDRTTPARYIDIEVTRGGTEVSPTYGSDTWYLDAAQRPTRVSAGSGAYDVTAQYSANGQVTSLTQTGSGTTLRRHELSAAHVASGKISRYQLVQRLFGRPTKGGYYKTTHFVEIDVSGLNLIKGREHVFTHLSDDALDTASRIVRSGKTPF